MQSVLACLVICLSQGQQDSLEVERPILPSPTLVWNPFVQDDLRLSVAQRLRVAGPELGPGQIFLTEREKRALQDLPDWRATDIARSMRVNNLLTRQQRERLWQVSVQLGGAMILRNKEVARRIGLTAAQDKKLRNLLADHESKTIQLHRTTPLPKAKTESEAHRLRQKTLGEKSAPLYQGLLKSMMSVLTPEQRKRYTALKGKPLYSAFLPWSTDGPGRRKAMLLLNSRVQKELGLGLWEVKSIDKLIPRATRALSRQAHIEFQARVETGGAKALALLKPAQRERLRQIAIQLQGPMAALNPEEGSALNISYEQLEVIRKVTTDIFMTPTSVNDSLKQVVSYSPREPQTEDQKRLARAEQERLFQVALKEQERHMMDIDRSILRILTPSQRRRFEAMQGRPFIGLRELIARYRPSHFLLH
jgi:hypothetical protein